MVLSLVVVVELFKILTVHAPVTPTVEPFLLLVCLTSPTPLLGASEGTRSGTAYAVPWGMHSSMPLIVSRPDACVGAFLFFSPFTSPLLVPRACAIHPVSRPSLVPRLSLASSVDAPGAPSKLQ